MSPTMSVFLGIKDRYKDLSCIRKKKKAVLSSLYGKALEGDPGSVVFYWGGMNSFYLPFEAGTSLPFEPVASFLSTCVFKRSAFMCLLLYGNTPHPDPTHQLPLGTKEGGLWLSSPGLYSTSVWLLPLSACFSSGLS